MGSGDAVRNLFTINYQMRVSLPAPGKDHPTLLCPPENLLKSSLPSLPRRRGTPLWERGRDRWRGKRTGVLTCTDVQIPRFKCKLNAIPWLIKY